MIRKLFGESEDTLSESKEVHAHGIIKASDDERFANMLSACQADLKTRTDGHRKEWGFGDEVGWDFDSEEGRLSFTFPNHEVSAPAQVVGLYQKDSATWSWAWAKKAISFNLTGEARKVRKFGQENGFEPLVEPAWCGPIADAWNMAAIACSLSQAAGVFCGHSDKTAVYFLFGDVETTGLLEKKAG